MKKYFKFLLLLPLAAIVASCSSDDEEYNADTAITPYEPLPAETYRMIKSIKLTQDYNGRNYSWNYDFSYDAQNRIKSVDCDIVAHEYSPKKKKWYKFNGNTTMNYYFIGENVLKIVSMVNKEYPETGENKSLTTNYVGQFNNSGALIHFGQFDAVYSGNILQEAHLDNERVYTFYRDRYNNVTGYRCDSVNKVLADYSNIYNYVTIENNTNIDLSGFIGNWVIEREIPLNEQGNYPILFLAAFDMLGTRSQHLPDGTWAADNKGYPSSCTLPSGKKLKIEYME